MKSAIKQRLIILLCAILSSTLTLAQSTVSGKVTDNSGKGISGASVSAGGGRGTSTDANGNYSLLLNNGPATITASFVGYITAVKSLSLSGNATVDFVLIEGSIELGEIVLTTGSRSLPRSSINTPLPIDALQAADLKTTAQTTFDKQLQYRVPSFNTINTPVNDATTLLDPYEIRNLGPSRTLILVNGKRKNLSSLLYVQFAPGRGETGADLSGIPIDAIKRVEILRDGASAQYGSDAIAGVMNVILKDKIQYGTLTFNGGVTHKGDGENYGVAYNGGSTFASNGFINYTVDFSQTNDAVRSGTIHRPTEKAIFGGNASADAAIDAFLNVYPTANNINGTGETQAAKFNYNLGIPAGGDNSQFYSNAALVFKKVYSHANYRAPYWRLDNGLLHKRIPGAPNYTGGNNPLYEGYIGYVPTFDGDLLDYHATVGFKNIKNGWNHDVSATFGGNQQLYTVENTVNASLGAASPTYFKPGGYRFSHIVGNYDISKSVMDNLSIAFGTEVRSESYKIIAGDTASYSGEGANSFPGIRAENASTNNRFNLGAYVDASWDITDAWLLNGAVRGEKYSDYGSSFVWKVSSRYKLADKAVIRASISTGFRAPSLHQIFAQSTQAGFFNGVVQLSGLFNNRSKQAFLLGIPKLKEEESTNFTVGLGLTPVKNLSITLDYYNINIDDRIVLSPSISTTDQTTALYQIMQQAGVVNVQFFINGIETRTQGLDLVASYRNLSLGSGMLSINLAGNYTLSNEVIGEPNNPPAIASAGASIMNAQIKSILTESRPEYKAVVGFDYKIKKLGISLNNTVFGPTRFQDLDNGGAVMNNIKQEFKTAVVTDLNLGYDFTNRIAAFIAVNNLFNVLPEWELKLTGSPSDPNYSNAVATLSDKSAIELLEGFLAFSGRYRILGYNGSQFNQLGTIFQASLVFRF